MFSNVAPPNIGPQVPESLILDPKSHQNQLREFSRDLKLWWNQHSGRLRPDGYEKRKAYYKMRSIGAEIHLPESLIEWLKAADIQHDRRAWKAIERSIMTASFFKKSKF